MTKKISIIISSILLFAVYLKAQDNRLADSTLRMVRTDRTDTAKAALLYKLGDQLTARDTAKAINYIRQGIHLSKDAPFYQGLGHFYSGRLYMDHDLEAGDKAFDKALQYFEKFATPSSFIYQSRTWANKAIIAQLKSDNRRYIELQLNKVIPLAAKAGDSTRVAVGYANIALPFMNYGDYDKAIHYLDRSVIIFRRNNPMNMRQTDNYTSLAKIYTTIGNYPKAKEHLDSAFNVLKQDSESQYAAYYHTTAGMYYIDIKEWKRAEESLDKGLAIAEKINNRYDIRTLLYQKARLYDSKRDLTAAKAVLLKMHNEGYITTESDRKQLYHDLAVTEAGLGNTIAAYGWLTKYCDLADSFYQKQTALQIADLEKRYNYAQKERELLLANSKSKMQQLVMWGSLTGLLLASFLFTYLYRLRKAKTIQEVQSLKQQQQIALAQALLQGEEKERTRMARDLHDGLGGMLAGVKLNLTNVLQDHTSAEMDRVIRQLDGSVTELRRIARNMMPEALLRSGLETALTDLCQSLSSDVLHLDFRFMNISSEIPKQVQIIIYRIIQELLANVVRHSGATEAFLQCSQDENNLYITVEDNGKGFVPSAGGVHQGLGLENIRSRIDFLKGKIEIKSGHGEGTITNIELKTDGKG